MINLRTASLPVPAHCGSVVLHRQLALFETAPLEASLYRPKLLVALFKLWPVVGFRSGFCDVSQTEIFIFGVSVRGQRLFWFSRYASVNRFFGWGVWVVLGAMTFFSCGVLLLGLLIAAFLFDVVNYLLGGLQVFIDVFWNKYSDNELTASSFQTVFVGEQNRFQSEISQGSAIDVQLVN